MTSRRAARAGVGAVLVALLAACGPGPNLVPRTTTGSHGRPTYVNVDAVARTAVLGGITAYVTAKNTKIISAAGTPDAVVTSVKRGAIVDVVVLPDGPELTRVSDELVKPPERIGVLGGRTYYVGTVTSRGLIFTKFLATAQGRAVLRQQGFAP